MEQDAKVKRAKFIQLAQEINETFKFAVPPERVRALRIHCSSFYDAVLIDLTGE